MPVVPGFVGYCKRCGWREFFSTQNGIERLLASHPCGRGRARATLAKEESGK